MISTSGSSRRSAPQKCSPVEPPPSTTTPGIGAQLTGQRRHGRRRATRCGARSGRVPAAGAAPADEPAARGTARGERHRRSRVEAVLAELDRTGSRARPADDVRAPLPDLPTWRGTPARSRPRLSCSVGVQHAVPPDVQGSGSAATSKRCPQLRRCQGRMRREHLGSGRGNPRRRVRGRRSRSAEVDPDAVVRGGEEASRRSRPPSPARRSGLLLAHGLIRGCACRRSSPR